jgi:GNAT superfamily N-acetyltransferase
LRNGDASGVIDVYRAIEAAEADAWEEIQRSSSPSFRDEHGVTVHRIRGALLVASRVELAALNRLWLPGSPSAPVDEVLDEAIDRARETGSPKLLVHCPPWAAGAALFERRGLRATTPMTKLYRRPGNDDHVGPFRIETIGTESKGIFEEISAIASGVPAALAHGFNSTIGTPGWIHYLAFSGNDPVAVAGLRLRNGTAWCCMAATLESYRRRGAQTAMLARRVRDAAAAGCSWVTCESIAQPSGEPSESRRNMERVGFQTAYDRPSYICEIGSPS